MQYCEQALAVAGFETWNALSNLAFVAAAAAAWRARAKSRGAPRGFAPLVLTVLAIAAGSFAWHATHAPLAELADVLPILGFVVGFLYVSVRQRPAVGALGAGVASAALLAAIVVTGALAPRLLNGSAAYLPVLAALLLLAASDARPAARRLLVCAGGLFAVSLVARTVDPEVCAWFARGSHWGWHLCNGGVIALALQALLVPPASDTTPSRRDGAVAADARGR